MPARAEDFPPQPIKIIVPFAPSGPVDVLARAVDEGVRQWTNQPPRELPGYFRMALSGPRQTVR